MSITNTNAVAKIAAVVAGLGLVFASFAPVTRAQSTSDLQAQIAALLAQINSLQSQLGTTTTTASVMFNADLTIGSTGTDVTALQNWLIAKGYSIPAGATGYFGAQTQSALAAYQAANGISPAAGYFGPITRAKVNASTGTTTTTTTTTTGGSTTGLSGGEADISGFDLKTGEDLNEDDSNVEIADAQFDVEGGDINVQRVKVVMQATLNNVDDKPWQYVDSLSVYSDGKKIGEADAGSKSDWDSDDNGGDFNNGSGDYYTLTIDTNGVVKEGDNMDLSIHADAQSNFDSDSQSFEVTIPDDGIRAVDAAGIQEYTGKDSDHVNLSLGEAESGDLSIRESDEDPDSSILVADDTDTTDDLTVFAFDVKNSDDADALLDSINIGVTSASSSAANIIRKATLTIDGDDYDGDISSNHIDFDDMDTTVDGNDTVTGVLTIELYGQQNHYSATGESLSFSLASGDVEAEGADTGDDSTVDGGYTSNSDFAILLSGVNVAAKSTSESVNTPGTSADATYGTYTIKFDVTAVEDDAFIAKTAATTTAANSTGVTFAVVGSPTYVGPTAVATLSSTAATSGNYFKVSEGSTETFTLTVTLNPATGDSGTYEVDLTQVNFNTTAAAGTSIFPVDSSNDDFKTDPQYIAS